MREISCNTQGNDLGLFVDLFNELRNNVKDWAIRREKPKYFCWLINQPAVNNIRFDFRDSTGMGLRVWQLYDSLRFSPTLCESKGITRLNFHWNQQSTSSQCCLRNLCGVKRVTQTRGPWSRGDASPRCNRLVLKIYLNICTWWCIRERNKNIHKYVIGYNFQKYQNFCKRRY